MTDNLQTNKSDHRATDAQDWDALYARIRKLALEKSERMIRSDDEDEAFDRSARSLRTLMSAAEAVRRMKAKDEKEAEPHEETGREPALTEDRIKEVYQSIEDAVARVEREEREATDRGSDPEAGLPGSRRKAVEAQRS